MDNTCYQRIIDSHDESFFQGTYLYDVMKFFGKENLPETLFLREIFYELVIKLDNLDYGKSLLYVVKDITDLLRKKVREYDDDSKKAFYAELYDLYIRALFINYCNGDYEAVQGFFQILNEKVKMISGYYGKFGLDEETYEELEKKYSLGAKYVG